MNEPALVLFSGGQDSTTCLFWAKKHFTSVTALCFQYGQRHAAEIGVAREIAEKAAVPFELVDLTVFGRLAHSSITDPDMRMDQEKPENSWPNTFVPGRNLFFLTIAAVKARSLGIRHLITGVSQADYSGYPDCRHEFIRSAENTLNLAMAEHFEIHTPLMWKNKAEVWKLSDELGVLELVKNETLTCYHGVRAKGCGHCPACLLRNKGLQEYLDTRNTD